MHINKKINLCLAPQFKGKLAHIFTGNTFARNCQIVLFVGDTIVYKENKSLKNLLCTMKKDDYIHVFMREFLICDVAQGLNGDPPILSKGNPLV